MLRSIRRMLRTPTPVIMTAAIRRTFIRCRCRQDPARDPFVRPRSRGALLVTIDGVVVIDRRATRRANRHASGGVRRGDHPCRERARGAPAGANRARSHGRDDRWHACLGLGATRRVPRCRIQARHDRASLLSRVILSSEATKDPCAARSKVSAGKGPSCAQDDATSFRRRLGLCTFGCSLGFTRSVTPDESPATGAEQPARRDSAQTPGSRAASSDRTGRREHVTRFAHVAVRAQRFRKLRAGEDVEQRHAR